MHTSTHGRLFYCTAILLRLANPQCQEILDPDNSEVISQAHLFDDKLKPDVMKVVCLLVGLWFCFNDSVDFYTGRYSDKSRVSWFI